MIRFYLVAILLGSAIMLMAQSVNEPLIRQKVEEALRKHRQANGEPMPVSSEQSELQRKAETRAEKTAAYIESQRQLNESAEVNIEAAREWSAKEMKARHSLTRDGNYTRASVNDVMAFDDYIEVNGEKIEISPAGLFHSRSELDRRLRRHYFVDFESQTEQKPMNVFRKAWDFIDMDYVEYLNSDRRSLGEDVARKFYKNLREVALDGGDIVSQKWSGIVDFMKSDWMELYQQKRIEIKEGFIGELPARSKRLVGRISPAASKAVNKISVIQVISHGEATSIGRILSEDFARVSVDAVYSGDMREVDARMNLVADDITRVASDVIEKETGVKIKKVKIDSESLSSEIADKVTGPVKRVAKNEIGQRFYQGIRNAFPEEVECYEITKVMLK